MTDNCEICGSDKVTTENKNIDFEYNHCGKIVTLKTKPVKVYSCPNCCVKYTGGEAELAQQKVISEFLEIPQQKVKDNEHTTTNC